MSSFFDLTGESVVIPTACAAGNYAVGTALSLIRHRRADIVVAGGSDCFSRSCFNIFNRLGGSTPDYCAPFDEERRGMAVGEGSGVVVVESLTSARRRL